MFEIKIVNGLARLHSAGIRLALRSLNKRDRLAVRKYHKQIDLSDRLLKTADDVRREAAVIEERANAGLDKAARVITAAVNELNNRLDDLEAK